MPLVVIAVLTLAMIGVAAVLPSQLVASKERVDGEEVGTPFALTPAAAQPVDDRIVFGDLGDQAEQFAPVGDIYFVTVTEPEQSVLSWLAGRDEPAIQFRTRLEKFGVQTPQQRRRFALESMRTSEQEAQYVALQRLGYDVSIEAGDVLIEAMVCLEADEGDTECVRWSPSDDVLDPGDRIIEVDDEPVSVVGDLTRILSGKDPGDVVSMRIDRPEEGELVVTVELSEAPSEPGRTIVGFYPFDTSSVSLPFELDIDTGSIGGPSAGLAFTLTLIDELTEGELTGGGRVAVTGTIDLDGSVGPIGGLRQKASAVTQVGVELFIVPGLSEGASEAQSEAFEANIAAAQAAGGDGLEIVPVLTLEEALEALEARGGDPISPPPDIAG